MYNPMYYNNFFPYQNLSTMGARKGLLAGITGLNKVNWGNLLTNTQKTLNVINQAIPVYYQIKPIYNNAKTMFRVFGAMNDNSSRSTTNNEVNNIANNTTPTKNISDNNQPIFFT